MNCTVCTRKKITSEAAQFCADCNKYYCNKCLEAHDIVHDDHMLMDIDDDSVGKTEVLPTERCNEHPAEIIKMFCRSHDLTVCNTCAFMNHRMCKDVVYIPSEIHNLMPQSEVDTSKQLMITINEKLADIQKAHKSEEDIMQQEKNSCLDQIDELADKLIAKIQDMKQAAVDNVVVKFQKLEEEKQAKSTLLQDVEEDLEACSHQLENSAGNLPQAFVMMKKSQKMVSKFEKLQKAAVKTSQSHIVNFLMESAIEQYLSGFQCLASFKKPQKKQLRREPDLQVKDSWDKEMCNISGACILQDGAILLADSSNKNLKRMNASATTITDLCALTDEPFAVCAINQHEAAVTLNNNRFQFVSLGNKMRLLKSYSVQHGCYGIVFHSGELFVTDGGSCVYVYNKIGQQQRVLSTTAAGQPMFTQTRHITLCPQGERVYVACLDSGMVCIDKKGQELFKSKGSEICQGFGVCKDGNGAVFVSGAESNNVVQLREGGEAVGEVLTHENGIEAPRAIFMDQSKNRMYVSQENSNVVGVFSIV